MTIFTGILIVILVKRSHFHLYFLKSAREIFFLNISGNRPDVFHISKNGINSAPWSNEAIFTSIDSCFEMSFSSNCITTTVLTEIIQRLRHSFKAQASKGDVIFIHVIFKGKFVMTSLEIFLRPQTFSRNNLIISSSLATFEHSKVIGNDVH